MVLSIADEQGVTGLLPQFVASLQREAPQLTGGLIIICVTPQAYQACTDSPAHVTCFLDAQVRGWAPGFRVLCPLATGVVCQLPCCSQTALTR